MLLRSANLQHLTAADRDRLADELGVRVVVDLRTHEELRLEGEGPLVADGRIELRHRSLYPEKGTLTDVMIGRADGERPAVGYYLGYLRDRPDSIVGALEDVAGADGAVLVHCAAGKDRTGVAAALLLSILGVPRDVILEDYLLSNMHYVPKALTISEFPDEVRAAIVKVQPSFLNAALDTIDSRWGSVERYLQDTMNIGPRERMALAASLTEPA